MKKTGLKLRFSDRNLRGLAGGDCVIDASILLRKGQSRDAQWVGESGFAICVRRVAIGLRKMNHVNEIDS
jgi:hypothetical protein